MGLIIAPIALLLLSALMPGIIFGIKGVSASKDKLFSLILIIVVCFALSAICYFTPFVLRKGGKGGWDILFEIWILGGGALLILGAFWGIIFLATKKDYFALFASGTFFSIALLPIAWFTLTDKVMLFLNIIEIH